MKGLIKEGNTLNQWFKKITKSLIKRGEKDARKLKGQPQKKTSWQIIKLLYS